MPTGELERIFAALDASDARYLVVGGVAVVLHGHPRLTADLDLVIALDPANVRAAVGALQSLGYRPRAPVSLDDFADPEQRRSWIDEKGMTVLSLASPELRAHRGRPLRGRAVPIRAGIPTRPDRFDRRYSRHGRRLRRSRRARAMASRPKDLADVEALEAIRREADGGRDE